MLSSPLPRLAPKTLRRARLSAWLAKHESLPLRLVCGPAGAGKTSAIVTYLAERAGAHAFLTLRANETPESLRERIASAAGLAYVPASFAALVAGIATVAPFAIAVDAIDRGTPETIEELTALVAEAPEGIGFIYGARSRAALDTVRLLANGLAALLDASQLAFDADDVARLAELNGVSYAPGDVSRLLEETEGWPIVASWVVRGAADSGSSLAGAYDRWRRAHGRHFAAYLQEELRAAGESLGTALRSSLRASGASDEQARLAALETRGLFVTYAGEAYRPYRVARQFDLEAIPAASLSSPEPAALLVVRLFGRFEAEIGGRRIEWIRRREAQLFKYLLLKPNGTASRAELREVFWPEADAHLATQSLRTAASNVRKAIAALVGYGSVERYFSSQGDIAVRLEHTAIDARRFTAHVADGDAERERGHVQEAFAHYRAAESLYGGELLCGEFPEPWYAPRAEMFRALYIGLLERLAEYHADTGHGRQAREYATRANDLRPRLALVGSSA